MTQPAREAVARHGAGAADTRQAIIDAAWACFRKVGLRQTTIVDISQEAGVSRGTVYQYFRDKADIVEAIAERISERFYRHMVKAMEHGRTLEEKLVGEIALPLWILLGTAGIVLLIACANVANLLLARAEDRRRSFAVRRSLGASRGDLVRAQMVEALVIAALGGVGGVAIAIGGVPLLVRGAPESIPRLASTTLDPMALAFTASIVLFAM